MASRVPLHCIAVDVDTALADDLTDLRSEEDLRCALLASSRMPWIGGGPVEFRGRRWLDGGLAEPIPHQVAVGLGATHVLVLMTRPLGVSRTPPPRLANRIIERRLRRLNPALVELHRRRTSDYEAAVSEIAAATSEPGPRAPFVYGLRLARGGPRSDSWSADPRCWRRPGGSPASTPPRCSTRPASLRRPQRQAAAPSS